MKKNIFFVGLLAVMLLAVPTLALTSCGGDDEVGGGSGSTTTGVVDPKSGLRLASYDDPSYASYTYQYTDDGKLAKICGPSESYEFSYAPNKVTGTSGDEGEIKDMTCSLSYNGSGYITALDMSWDIYINERKDLSGSEKATLSYDGSGHLIKATSTYIERGTNDDETYSSAESWTGVFTWTNNRLEKVVTKWKSDDGESESATITFEYDGGYTNPYRQWSPSLTDVVMGSFLSLSAYVGLLGVGPTELPSSSDVEWIWSESDEVDTEYAIFDYTFDREGALGYSYINGERYSFGYDYTDSKETRTAVNISNELVKRHAREGFLFHRHYGNPTK